MNPYVSFFRATSFTWLILQLRSARGYIFRPFRFDERYIFLGRASPRTRDPSQHTCILPSPKRSFTRPQICFLIYLVGDLWPCRLNITKNVFGFGQSRLAGRSSLWNTARLQNVRVIFHCYSLSMIYRRNQDPYPFAVDEAFDMYRLLVETSGKVIGMSGRKLNIIMSGDSASVLNYISNRYG
jgi:hypothetical protein